MYTDLENLFSDAQAITVDAVGTNVIDLATARAIGNGEPMSVEFSVDVAADQTTGDEDYTFQVEVSTDAAQTAGRQILGKRIFESGTPDAPAQDADLLVAGFKFAIPIPMATIGESARYLGIRYDVTGTTPTITVTAALRPTALCEVGQLSYPKGYTIS